MTISPQRVEYVQILRRCQNQITLFRLVVIRLRANDNIADTTGTAEMHSRSIVCPTTVVFLNLTDIAIVTTVILLPPY